MKVFRNLNSIELDNETCTAIGVFDGVHIGHQKLIKRVTEISHLRGLISLALTFEPHPEALFSPKGAPPLLTDTEEKLALLKELGLNVVVVVPFTREFANTPPNDFVSQYLAGKLKTRYLVAGPETTFGKGAKGDTKSLKMLGRANNIQVEVAGEVQFEGKIVSSTAIRDAVTSGKMDFAVKMLGRPYRLSGTVIPGDGRGKSLGFPTANLRPPEGRALPPDGVYACVAGLCANAPQFNWDVLNDPDSHVAVVYIGRRPTFDNGERIIEVHICEDTPDLYGKNLEVYLFSHLRGDITFSGPDELVQQMVKDAHRAFEVVGEYYSKA